jgi:putative hemolysin
VFGGYGLWRPPPAEPWEWVGWLLILVLIALLLLSSLVIVPWTAARVGGERFLYHVWPLVEALMTACRPLLAAARVLDTLAHRLSGVEQPPEGDAATLTEEIRSVVDEGHLEGLLESGARTMIHRVMELQKEDVAAVMTPRTEMVTISADATLEEARRIFLEAGHSRIPLIGETTDDIVGVLYAKDLLRYLDATNGRAQNLREIVRDPFYVPETTGIDTLLETMKRDRVHFAVVIDEYGGVAGLVTMEDILEEIVGEIVDEYDVDEEAGIHPVAPGVVDVEARVHIDDLNEEFGFDFPENGDFDTIGGFVYSQLGRIPEPQESFTWHQWRITVLEADKRRLHRLRIEMDESLAATPQNGG